MGGVIGGVWVYYLTLLGGRGRGVLIQVEEGVETLLSGGHVGE